MTTQLQFFLIAVAGWMNRHQQAVIEHIQEENRVLLEQLGGKSRRFPDPQRIRLARKAKLVGRRRLGLLTALGVTNYVIRPRNWDDQHKRVKTDRTDALAMLNVLDRFVAGNPHALAVVRVPTEQQERQRSQTRIRQSLHRDLKLLAQRGRGVALQYGYRLKGKWYGARNWPKLEVPDWLHTLLSPLQGALATVHEQVRVQSQQILKPPARRPNPKAWAR